VGVAIDRLGFTVEDRDRAKGIFYVRYRDPTAQVEDKKGFFGRIFSSSASTDPVQYQVSVTGQANQSVIRVLNKTGQPINDANAQRVLTVLFEQLK
jgi:outer membrane protein assembly factor BamC